MVWLALAIALLAVVATAVWTLLRGLEAYRGVKGLGRSVGVELDRIAAASGGIERHLALAAESGTRLSVSLERLSRSRAQLNVLTSALADVQAALGRVTSVYPRK